MSIHFNPIYYVANSPYSDPQNNLLGEIPFEERKEFVDHAKTLQKIEIRESGFPMPFRSILEKLASIPTPAKREQVIGHILDLYESKVPGAEESLVLDFLINTPEEKLIPIINIAKEAFFDSIERIKIDFDDFETLTETHCIDVLKSISKMVATHSLTEDQLQAFENLKVEKEWEGGNLNQKCIYKVLFGNQDSIRRLAFNAMQGDYPLFLWVKELCPSLLTAWLQENPKAAKFFTSCMELSSLDRQVKSFSDKLLPGFHLKNLVACHVVNKEVRRNAKGAMSCFLNTMFESKEVLSVTEIPAFHHSHFELKGDRYRLFESGDLFKNDQVRVKLGREKQMLNEKLLSYFLQGNRFERVTTGNEYQMRTKSAEFWNNWEATENRCAYQNMLHPMICQAVLTLLQSKDWPTFPVVLDVGGGTGSLAYQILQMGKLDYTLLENNAVELQQAKQLLGDKAIATDIVKDDFPVSQETVDIAIASGILTKNVLKDRDQALSAFKKIAASIKPGGFFLMTGLADSYIDGNDLEKAGFEVINTTLPQSLKQFYIARKK